MAHTHEFDCRICGAHLDSQQELDKHTTKQHEQGGMSATPSQSDRSDRDGRQNKQS